MKRVAAVAFALFWSILPARAEESFTPLFNGKDLTDWVVEGTTKVKVGDEEKPVWSVVDGLIHCQGAPKSFGFLRYDKAEYADFILHVEYRMAKNCNSGIGVRTVKFTGKAETRPSFAAYEIQLLDDAGKKVDEHSSFSLYRYVPATSNPSKPAGEWNVVDVKCVGPLIQITVNGVLCQDTDQTRYPEIKDKWLSGYVCVQNHGGTIDFRNIGIRDLGGKIEPHPPLKEIPAETQPAENKPADKKASDKKAADKKASDKKDAAKKPADDAKKTSASEGTLHLQLQSCTETVAGSGKWNEQKADANWQADQTALIICDLWDKHWCDKATERCDVIAHNLAPVVEHLRSQGVKIVHCPSDTIGFYKDTPQRRRMLAVPAAEPPSPIARWCKLDASKEAALPIDDTDNGCDDPHPVKSYHAWSRQHPAVQMRDGDVLSDDGREVYNYFVQQGVKNILYCGVHLNMCVLGRSFGIRQMKQLGFNTVLIRDLTDTMYNPQMRPQVPHEEGTALMIEHVEKYWCPTLLSQQLAAAK